VGNLKEVDMLVRVVKSCLQIVLGLVLLAGPANAVTTIPGFLGNTLTNGLYKTGDVDKPSSTPFVDVWEFNVLAGPLVTVVKPTVLNPDGSQSYGIKNLTFKWQELAPSLVFTDGSGQQNNALSLVATLTPGLYHLIVSGTTLGQGGTYSYTLAATPLPAAVVLFGSGLLGLSLLGRRRRSTKPRDVL
jgi:hypothetical protein